MENVEHVTALARRAYAAIRLCIYPTNTPPDYHDAASSLLLAPAACLIYCIYLIPLSHPLCRELFSCLNP